MTATIETSATWSKNKSIGSMFSLNLVPPDFSTHEVEYEHPKYGIKAGFRAKWIEEQKALEKNGHTKFRRVISGIVLIAGELRRLIANAASGKVNDLEIDEVVQDCHKLIVEYIKGQHEFDRFDITPHVYEADARRFSFLPSLPTPVRSTDITDAQIKLVF